MPEPPKLPPIATAPLSLVLLAQNPGPHLDDLVHAWRDVLSARKVPFEILLVDDGNALQLAECPDLRILRHDVPRGIGAALQTGLAEVAHPLIAVAPCDPAYRPQDLALFLAHIDPVHLLTGYRAGKRVPFHVRGLGLLWRLGCRLLFNHSAEKLPGWLGWRGHLGALLARIFFGVQLRDVACPFRVFRRDILARSPIQSRGSFAWVEQLAKVNFINGVFGHEIPLNVIPQRPPASFQRFLSVLAEAKRVFAHPSFGPARLPVPTSEDAQVGTGV